MKESKITVQNLTMAYDDYVVMRNLSFDVKSGEIFLIIGGSGCGKSTLLKYLIGLKFAPKNSIFYENSDINKILTTENISKKFGVLFQSGALWGDLTLQENVALPLEYHTDLSKSDIAEIASLKLSLVGLGGFEKFYPYEISGGMKKRAALARAMALDPEILFFDEPSAGLDPITSKHLDDLILQIRDSFGTTIVIVTHELASILSIGDRLIFLDADTKSSLGMGSPQWLLEHAEPKVRSFLSRGNFNE